MTENPKVSVIMGIYNCEKTLPEAIESIIGQTYTNWELIMCDDGSSDGTYAVARSYADRYPQKITLLRNETNRKLSYTLNRCLEAASGELIARMDGDDMCRSDRFQKQIDFLQSHPDIQLVGTGMQFFDMTGYHRVLMHPHTYPTKDDLKRDVPFFHATIMTYAWVYAALGGYSEGERIERVEDVDLWFRFFKRGYIGANLGEALYFVRENDDAIRRRTLKARINEFVAFKNGIRLLGLPRRFVARKLILIGIKALLPFSVMKWVRKKRGLIGGDS